MRIECECECGNTVFVYPRDEEVYGNAKKTFVAKNGCIKCGARVEAYITVETIKSKEQ